MSSTLTIVASELVGPAALDALRSGVLEAFRKPGGDVVVDMRGARAIDGACLALVLWAAGEFPADREFAVLPGPELARSFSEWRVDAVLKIAGATGGPGAAVAGEE